MNTNNVCDELRKLCENARAINEENLLTILHDNKDTEFGKKYGFADIGSIDEYKKKVPVTDYRDYRDYVTRMLNGERNVITAYTVEKYGCTSGTTGTSKIVPKSLTSLERENTITEDSKNLFRNGNGKRLMISSFRTYPQVAGKPLYLVSEIYYDYLLGSGKLNVDEYVGGKDLLMIPEESRDLIYAKAAAALACDNIDIIEASFLYETVNFFSYLEENWKTITDDLRHHRLPDGLGVPENVKKYLLSLSVPDERLDLIERECSNGFENIAVRLWSGLTLLSGIGHKTFLTEDNALKRYIGNTAIHYFSYVCSECLIGVPVQLNEHAYVVVPKTGFFEFLPVNAETTDVTYQPSELETGNMYEIVITNFSGFYRYRIGDVIKVKRFIGESPVVEFKYRKGQALNISGEKIDMCQLEKAVFSLHEFGINVNDYLIGASVESMPGRYIAVMQTDSSSNENNGLISDEKASELLDEAVMKYSPDYKDLRELGQISEPTVFVCNCGEYVRFMEETVSGQTRSHIKAKHICSKEVSEKQWKKIIGMIREKE